MEDSIISHATVKMRDARSQNVGWKDDNGTHSFSVPLLIYWYFLYYDRTNLWIEKI
jgi:hypothetical protein